MADGGQISDILHVIEERIADGGQISDVPQVTVEARQTATK